MACLTDVACSSSSIVVIALAITALSLVVMPSLAWAKRRVAAGLNSFTLKADAAETQHCTDRSAVVPLCSTRRGR